MSDTAQAYGYTPRTSAERRRRPDRPDLDERFSLHPLAGEDVLRRLLDVDADDPPGQDEDTEPT